MDNLTTISEQQVQDHFAQLPKALQDAITSADIEKHLREIADTYKLHLDQWTLLENQVMLTLMGLARAEDLRENIAKNVGLEDTIAAPLAAEISRIVFDPIRGELERVLSHPVTQTGTASMPTPIMPLSSAPVTPQIKTERAPISDTYKSGETSATRKDVANDPYREPPV